MIEYIKQQNVNIEKYDACIAKAVNTRIYAYSWYLNTVADNWDVLVYKDYEAVMPLPWRSKYFIKYIYQPCWTQQLGVFYNVKSSEKLLATFLKAIPKKFKKVHLNLNADNLIENPKEVRVNYVLDINTDYETLHKSFRKDRKDRLRKALKSENVVVKKIPDVTILFQLFKENYQYVEGVTAKDYEKLTLLLQQSEVSKVCLGLYTKENLLISGAVFLIDTSRIYYLFSASTQAGKKAQGSTLLINQVLQLYAGDKGELDFEGSMLPGIANFYKSFGAVMENYAVFSDKNLL